MADETPFYLQGNFAPVTEETTCHDLEVVGALPPELSGMYVRNGSNPPSGHSAHWFLGPGMVHGVRLENGKAAWYRNRYVKTPILADPDLLRISDTGEVDRTASLANTHVIAHAGKILALEEGSFPYVLDRDLETVGWTDFEGKLGSAFSAHPHICPITGEMLSFGYAQQPPYLTYLRVSGDGKLVQTEEIEVPGPTMMHDFMVTERRAIFMDLPVVFDHEAAMAGTMPYSWSDDYTARIGIMPRTGTNADVVWFEIEPCYIFHAMNAWDEGDCVIYDVVRLSEVWREAGVMGGENTKISLHRFRFDLASGHVKEETLDDRPMEFPRIADARVGQKNRFGFSLAFGDMDRGEEPGLVGHFKFDLEKGTSERHISGKGRNPGEPVFVPAAGSDPDGDEGYVMTFVYDGGSNKSELVITDASNLAASPIARVKLPQRVPFGFHGSWLPDAD
ncbi:MAG: dioxygenase [Deltaproteobacteria bacterium]|jgi:carotenoid cleavage dioxygenase|nr:dioxygenase [Deltaproteobacteria bacterium]